METINNKFNAFFCECCGSDDINNIDIVKTDTTEEIDYRCNYCKSEYKVIYNYEKTIIKSDRSKIIDAEKQMIEELEKIEKRHLSNGDYHLAFMSRVCIENLEDYVDGMSADCNILSNYIERRKQQRVKVKISNLTDFNRFDFNMSEEEYAELIKHNNQVGYILNEHPFSYDDVFFDDGYKIEGLSNYHIKVL